MPNPACGHKEVRRSTGHIMVTTRYSDQQGYKWRQKVIRLYKQWRRPISKRLFFLNRCQTKEVPRELMFIFWKIKIGGVHLIEGFPNATRQRPEHSSFTTAARRQTAPPHHTHNFCWHDPRQRSHGEMPFLYLPFYFFAATTKCLYKRHLVPTT